MAIISRFSSTASSQSRTSSIFLLNEQFTIISCKNPSILVLYTNKTLCHSYFTALKLRNRKFIWLTKYFGVSKVRRKTVFRQQTENVLIANSASLNWPFSCKYVPSLFVSLKRCIFYLFFKCFDPSSFEFGQVQRYWKKKFFFLYTITF